MDKYKYNPRIIELDSNRNIAFGICNECSTKHGDSSNKQIYYCELCGKWFCELHLKPKFPYFVDWDTVFDVQGNPKIKALFYSEFNREGGHPDFVYWKQVFEKLDLEEQTRNQLITKGMDRMMQATKGSEKSYVSVGQNMRWAMKGAFIAERFCQYKKNEVVTSEMQSDPVFLAIYSDKKYRKKIESAKTVEEVESIIKKYCKKNHLNEELRSDKVPIKIDYEENRKNE